MTTINTRGGATVKNWSRYPTIVPASRGALPIIMGRMVLAIPMKMIARKRRSAVATGYLPEPKMPEMIPNSLRKGLNGGEPVMAKNPARKSPPVRGSLWSSPRTFSAFLVP